MPKRGRAYKDWLFKRLGNPEKAAGYINAAIEEDSEEALQLALKDVADANEKRDA